MTGITVKVDHARAVAAFRKAPEVMHRHVDAGLSRGAQEVANEARTLAPKLFSTLTNSILASQVGPLHWRVQPGVNYARDVEEGTGPAAGRSRYYPNPEALQQYIMLSPKMRGHKWAKPGSRARGEQELNIWFRARALAWYIYAHGTKPQPYMAPAVEAKRSRVIDLVREAAARGAREVMA
jgi:hypothetical protein